MSSDMLRRKIPKNFSSISSLANPTNALMIMDATPLKGLVDHLEFYNAMTIFSCAAADR